ncbi:FAD-dependent oxidoreductase [Nocardioides sp. LHD-245]|uniref:FAD-dependent oxidoreductase n=1 Tax=Nocardioides sp. LHD-245 TaxID=3051387 RepID=UPI0027DEEF13|nr:FAD-dependent oxidoreductase [Nocardioides sp. LHD-245]
MTSVWLDRDRPRYEDPLPEDGRVDDLIVGGGLTGLVTALLLVSAGRQVLLVDAHRVGGGTTGRTTGKVSLLQGTMLSGLMERRRRSEVERYVVTNRRAMEWLEGFCAEHDVRFESRDAVTYAATEDEVDRVRDEYDAARALGLPVKWSRSLDVPFPSRSGVTLPGQAQIDPWPVVVAMTATMRQRGARLVEGCRLTGLRTKGGRIVAEVATDGKGRQEVSAVNVVLATGAPVLDRGLHFTRLEALRSYVLACRHPAPPEAMYLSAGASSGASTRSVRGWSDADGPILLIGGAGHPVGRTRDTPAHLAELRAWTAVHFPAAQETHAWSAQDYRSHTGLPLVGRLPLSGGAAFVATGYNKWGLTNGVAAARQIADEILGQDSPGPSRATGPSVTEARPSVTSALVWARVNAQSGQAMIGGHLRNLVGRRSGDEGEEEHMQARSVCGLLPVCTHLGGPLAWNEVEESWDCALHGSRFTADGSVIEGPATRRLRFGVIQ